jgi:hypothetical protein
MRVRPRGLPGPLPAGERLIWQGQPEFRGLALHVFHVRKVAIYFAALILWRGWIAHADGRTLGEAAVHAAWALPLAALALGLLLALAWGYARTSVYTLTSKRVVIRTGLALPVTLNLPLASIASADLGRRSSDGDIALATVEGQSASWLLLWPHVRPWRMARPEPALKCLGDAEAAARLLAIALAESAGRQPEPVVGESPARAGPEAWVGQASAA